jgi:hypothetical protein
VGFFKRTVAIALLGAFGAVGLASAAAAASSDVTTPGWYWSGVDDAAYTISDAGDYYPNFLGSGIDFDYGWTEDAFDDFFYDSSVPLTVAYNGVSQDLVFSSVSADYVDNGLTTIVGTAPVDFGAGVTFDLSLTLNIQGSYARWVFGYVSRPGGVGDVSLLQTHIMGNMGSDTDAHYALVGPNALVEDDQNNGDPVVGVYFDAPGAWAYDVTDGNDDLAVDFAGPTGTFVLSLQSYDPCSFDAAIAAMTALVPTLPATFGGDNALILSPTCLAISAPAPIGIGSTANDVLTFTQDPRLADWWDIADGNAPEWFHAVALNLPAGLTLGTEFDPGTNVPSLRLIGTAPGGTYVVRVLSYWDDGSGAVLPVVSTFTVEVVLAATGSDSASLLWLAFGLIGVGAGLVVLARRVRPQER